MTHYQTILEKLLLVLFTPIIRLSHAKTWRRKVNASLENNAHSTTMKKKEESSLILSQIFQKEWLFHQCQRKSDRTINQDITTTTMVLVQEKVTMMDLKTLAQVISVHWTINNHHQQWSRSLALLRWLLLVDLIQISISNLCQKASKQLLKAYNLDWAPIQAVLEILISQLRSCLLKLNNNNWNCINNKWCNKCKETMLTNQMVNLKELMTLSNQEMATKDMESTLIRITTTKTLTQDLQRKTLNTDTKRRSLTMLKTLLKRVAKKEKSLHQNRKDMSLNLRRL